MNHKASAACYHKASVLLLLMSFLYACTHKNQNTGLQPPERDYREHIIDGGPTEPIDLSQVKNAEPKKESLSRYGNHSPYYVYDKKYEVLTSNENFQEEGIASWYGTKFHGELTSSKEAYDMYAMTGAHKTLPLPSYVKVENLENGKEIIVRVNDRGPFKEGRIIDLSYAAAHKIEMHEKGTAAVRITVLPPFLKKEDRKQHENFIFLKTH